eukprot:7383681-Prymnesium_polylepis.1
MALCRPYLAGASIQGARGGRGVAAGGGQGGGGREGGAPYYRLTIALLWHAHAPSLAQTCT